MQNNIFTSGTVGDTPLALILPRSQILDLQLQPPIVKSATVAPGSLLEWLMKRIVIKGCAELWNISVLMKLHAQTSSISVSHLKLLLEQYEEKRSSVYRNRLVNLLLSNRHWSTELLIESLWWSLGSATRDNNLKKVHTRGSPFFLGVSLVKLSSYGSATKLDVSVHTLRVEYSVALATFVLMLCEVGRLYGLRKRSMPIKPKRLEDPSSESIYGSILVNANVTDITAFLFNHHDACILLSLAQVSLARTQPITVLKVDGFQTAILNVSEQPLLSLNEFTDVFSNIKVIRIEYMVLEEDVPQFNVYILNDTEAMWNPNLHMHIVTLVRDVRELKEKISPAPATLDIIPPSTPPSTVRNRPAAIFDVYAEGNTVLGIKISERHSMQLFVANFYLSRKDTKFLISMEKIFVNIDEMHIFTLKDIDVQSATSVDVLRQERKNYDHFVLPENKAWITTIGGFKGVFPYDHDFADAIQNEFNSTYKWLKVVHDIKKKPFTAQSPLPGDMIIQVKKSPFQAPINLGFRNKIVIVYNGL